MSRIRHQLSTLVVCALVVFALGGDCAPVATSLPPAGSAPPGSDPTSPPAVDAVWSIAFDTTNVGALSSVWGSGPNDVFMVGGRTTQAEVYHFDGAVWRSMNVPNVPLLVWVFGFGPNDVFAVGLGGGVVHFDGNTWTAMNSGTTEELWGVWGTSPNDLWIVGGTIGAGDPVLLHYNGQSFTPVPVPANDRGATSLFKVWGIGDRVIAVGENGLIIERLGGQWQQVPSGANADDDFVSLWGTNASNIVAVGGRSNARIATYNGIQWNTMKPPGPPGLNASFIDDPGFAVIGGVAGYVGRYHPGDAQPIQETAPTTQDVHAIWGDGTGRYWAVGGTFVPPFHGLAMVRTNGDPGIVPVPPIGVAGECASDAVCNDGDACTTDRCVSGTCVHTPINCDDGDPCTDDACAGGLCVHTPKACDDGDPCTTDACVGGNCTSTPINCDDGDPCTIDACVGGVCTNTPRDCDDANPCTVDLCNNGVCVHSALCGPDEICVAGICEPAPECFIDDDCDDGDPCTVNACVGGNCTFQPMVCDDGDPCTVDSCENGACVFTPIDCDDGDPCTVDLCGLASLKGDFNQDCKTDLADLGSFVDVLIGEDANPSHLTRADMDDSGGSDGTDISLFIQSVTNGTECESDSCIHVPLACDDGDPCTTDACVGGVCEFTPIPGCACTFETDCELGENCVNGMCQATSDPDLQVGVGGGTTGCITTPFEPFEEGGLFQFCQGFQGLTDILLTFRMTGFAPNAQVNVTYKMNFVGKDCTLSSQCDPGLSCIDNLCGPIPETTRTAVTTTDIGGGVNEKTDFYIMLFFGPNDLDGREANLSFVVEDAGNPAIRAEQTYRLTLFPRRFCFDTGPFCPPGQTCVDNFCVP